MFFSASHWLMTWFPFLLGVKFLLFSGRTLVAAFSFAFLSFSAQQKGDYIVAPLPSPPVVSSFFVVTPFSKRFFFLGPERYPIR